MRPLIYDLGLPPLREQSIWAIFISGETNCYTPFTFTFMWFTNMDYVAGNSQRIHSQCISFIVFDIAVY